MNDVVFSIFSVIVAVGLAVVFTAYPLWAVLHHILSRRLDRVLFREPYFHKTELINYLSWPLSYLKSMNYIYLIAAPRLAKVKRFKGFDEPLPVGKALKFACKVNFVLLIAGMLMFVVFFGYMGFAILFLA